MSITYQVLPILEGMEYIQKISQDHWDEVPFGDFDIGLDLNLELYGTLEQSGAAKFIAAIDEEKGIVVGYFVLLAAELTQHTGEYQASTDAFYVHPEYREHGVFTGLLQFTQKLCKTNGIRFFSVNVNPTYEGHESIRQALEKKAFQMTEYTMTIEVK